MKRAAFKQLKRVSPTLFYLSEYRRVLKNHFEPNAKAKDKLFNEFIDSCQELNCLQIGVKDNVSKKFGPNWTSVDLYDTREFVDYNYDIHDLKFEDNSFDAAVCISILEHVTHPQKAVQELHRVLKHGGIIWIQVPFCFYYHAHPGDYWRVSPEGLRIWMEDFDEITCACHSWTGSPLALSTYFHGKKKA